MRVASVTGLSSMVAKPKVCIEMSVRPESPFLDDSYPPFVRPADNQQAQAYLRDQFVHIDAAWHGIGTIPTSGFALKAHWAAGDARVRFSNHIEDVQRHMGKMSSGCDGACVVMGRIVPVEPYMVSHEGAWHIGWANGQRAGAAYAAGE